MGEIQITSLFSPFHRQILLMPRYSSAVYLFALGELLLTYYFLTFIWWVYRHVCACMRAHVHVEVRGKHAGPGSLLPLCRPQRSQVVKLGSPSLPTEPSHWPCPGDFGNSHATQGHLVSSCLQEGTSLLTSWAVALEESEGRYCLKLLARDQGVLHPHFSRWSICLRVPA